MRALFAASGDHGRSFRRSEQSEIAFKGVCIFSHHGTLWSALILSSTLHLRVRGSFWLGISDPGFGNPTSSIFIDVVRRGCVTGERRFA